MSKIEVKYLFLIIIIFIAACIETDIYLPAFPDMMIFFSVPEDQIQSILTWNFIGICLSGPFYGPLSDSFGRKKPLVIALGLFLIGSFITLFAQSFDQMLFGRLLQGIGSGGCFTLGTAVIFDAFQAKKAIEAVGQINAIVPFITAGAPVLGGYLNNAFGFRSNFLAITGTVLLSLIICLFCYEETLAKEMRKPFQTKQILSDFLRALLNIPFWQLTLIVSLLFAGYLVFLSSTAVLFVLELGVSKEIFPFYQASLLGIWLIASLTFNSALVNWGSFKIKMIGTSFIVMGGVGFLFATAFEPENPILLTVIMLIYTFGVNWTQGIYFPESMEILPDIKGITASLLTSIRLLVTAAVIGISSNFYDATIYPITAIIIGIILTTLMLTILYERKQRYKKSSSKSPVTTIH